MIKKFNIMSIQAQKFMNEYTVPNLKISNKSMVTDIAAADEGIKIEFIFIVEYTPHLANLKIEGNVIYAGADAGDILAAWKEKKAQKKIKEIQIPIVQRCLIESVILAKEINIVPPIPLPGAQQKKKEYGFMFG
jgi:hypothetical protein